MPFHPISTLLTGDKVSQKIIPLRKKYQRAVVMLLSSKVCKCLPLEEKQHGFSPKPCPQSYPIRKDFHTHDEPNPAL